MARQDVSAELRALLIGVLLEGGAKDMDSKGALALAPSGFLHLHI